LAAYNGHTEIVKLLLEHKAFVNVPDLKGRTALMFAASGPFPETVKLLLEHQADPNRADFQEHFTALMYAAAEGHLENVKILLGNKADPSLKDIDGDNALAFARNNGHADIVRILEAQHR
jgi:ankyrin repeat protein